MKEPSKPTELSQPSQPPNGTFDLRAFGSDVVVHSWGNGLLLLFGFIQLLIIPKYLSVEGYGYWQFFMLYASYVGMLHLGFIDGILVRWAGKELAQVGNEIKTALRFLLLEQLIVIIPLGLLLYILLQPPFQSLGLIILAYAFVYNLTFFFIFTAQAIRKFKLLTAVNVGRGLAFLILIVLLFVSGYLNYHYVILASLTAFLLALFGLAFWFRKYLWGEMPSISSLWAYGRENINIGIFVLLGNFVLVLFLTIDRLMVSSFFPIEQFAIYAFALAMTMIIYTFVGAVSQVFFPYLSGVVPELRTRAYQLGKPAIILAWAAILTIYFPLTRLIEFYLPHYVASLPIMRILLCTVGFGSLIQILHVNYYKAYRRQRQYFLWGIMALALSAMLNLLAIKVWGTLESVAIATLISFGIWYTINELSLKPVVEQSNSELGKGLAILGSYLGAFWLASFLGDRFITQMLIYIGIFCVLTWLLLRNEVKELVVVANGIRSQRR
ncbi:oligosaccharide flippase family protein [Dehalococcoidia bacterium]|nr:oligosaccharide flippase family protein [Dehalococcoidia bacterium]